MSLITLFLYLGTPASTTYPSRRRGPPPPLSPGCSSLSSTHLVSILTTIGTSSGQWSLCAPAQTASGSPVLSTTYGAVCQHPRTWTVLLASLFDTPLPRFSVLSCTESIRTFTFRTLMRRLTSVLSSSLLPVSGLFASRLFCCCCIVHPHKRTKTHENPENTTHHVLPLQSFPAPSHFVVSFTSLPHLRPTGRGAPHPPPPTPSYSALPCIRSTKPPRSPSTRSRPPSCSIASSPRRYT